MRSVEISDYYVERYYKPGQVVWVYVCIMYILIHLYISLPLSNVHSMLCKHILNIVDLNIYFCIPPSTTFHFKISENVAELQSEELE